MSIPIQLSLWIADLAIGAPRIWLTRALVILNLSAISRIRYPSSHIRLIWAFREFTLLGFVLGISFSIGIVNFLSIMRYNIYRNVSGIDKTASQPPAEMRGFSYAAPDFIFFRASNLLLANSVRHLSA